MMAKTTDELAKSLGIGLSPKNEPEASNERHDDLRIVDDVVLSTDHEQTFVTVDEKDSDPSDRRCATRIEMDEADDLFADTRVTKNKPIKTERVILALAKEDKDLWDSRAKEAGASLSEFVRRIVNSYCASN